MKKFLKYSILIVILAIVLTVAITLFYTSNKPSLRDGDLSEIYKNSKQSELVQTKFDLFNPVYSLVSKEDAFGDNSKQDGDKSYQVIVLTLERNFEIRSTNPLYISFWKIKEAKVIVVKNKTIAEVLDLVKKYDLTKNNPDKTNQNFMSTKEQTNLGNEEGKYNFPIRRENKNLTEEDFSFLKKGMKIEEIEKQVGRVDGFVDKEGYSFAVYLLSNKDYILLKFLHNGLFFDRDEKLPLDSVHIENSKGEKVKQISI